MEKTFMCDILTGYKEESMDLEQVLIKAKDLNDAFEKLINKRQYDNIHIYDQRKDGLFAHVETKDIESSILHIMIGEPSEIIE